MKIFFFFIIALNPKYHPNHFLESFTPFIIIPPVLRKHTFNKKWSPICTPIIQHRIICLQNQQMNQQGTNNSNRFINPKQMTDSWPH